MEKQGDERRRNIRKEEKKIFVCEEKEREKRKKKRERRKEKGKGREEVERKEGYKGREYEGRD